MDYSSKNFMLPNSIDGKDEPNVFAKGYGKRVVVRVNT